MITTTQIELAVGREHRPLARACTDRESMAAHVLDDGRPLVLGHDVVLNDDQTVSIDGSVDADFVMVTYECDDVDLTVAPTRDERLVAALDDAEQTIAAQMSSTRTALTAAGVSAGVADIMLTALAGVTETFAASIRDAIAEDAP